MGISTSLVDAALGFDPFKIADQKHAKIDSGRNPRAATDLAVVGSTVLLDPIIETRFFK